MPLSNQELARRADLALADLATNGGLMSPEQTEMFIDMVVEQPTILKQVRTVKMGAPTRKISRLGFQNRILTAASQTGGASDAGGNTRYVTSANRSKPTTSQIELVTKEVIAEVRIPYEALEDNIEGQNFENRVIGLIAERAAIDLEELALAGDTASGDPYLALLDGYLKQATVNVVDHLGAQINATMFTNGALAMPQKYLRNLAPLRNFVSTANHIKYRANLAARATGYGDSMLTTSAPIYAAGIAVEAAPMLSASNNGSRGLLTHPQNFIFGIQRQVQIETDKDIRSREIIIVLTARVDFQVDDVNAVVKYVNIG